MLALPDFSVILAPGKMRVTLENVPVFSQKNFSQGVVNPPLFNIGKTRDFARMLQDSMLAEKSQLIWVPTRRLTANIVHAIWALIDRHSGAQVTIVGEVAEKLDMKSRNLSCGVFHGIKSFCSCIASGFG